MRKIAVFVMLLGVASISGGCLGGAEFAPLIWKWQERNWEKYQQQQAPIRYPPIEWKGQPAPAPQVQPESPQGGGEK